MRKKQVRVYKKRKNTAGVLFLWLLVLAAVSIGIFAVRVTQGLINTSDERDKIQTVIGLGGGIYRAGKLTDGEGQFIAEGDEHTKKLTYDASTQLPYSNLMGASFEDTRGSEMSLLGILAPYLYGYYDNRLFDFSFTHERVGGDAQLTILNQVQEQAYQALVGAGYQDHTACVIVSNYSTGEVLAVTSTPGFSAEEESTLRKDSDGVVADDRGICVPFNLTFNMGSTIKPIIAAAALEMDGSNAGFTYRCAADTHTFGNDIINCDHNELHGDMDMTSAMRESCNGYFISLGNSLDPEGLEKKMKSFGFDDITSYNDIHYQDPVFSDNITTDVSQNLKFIGQGETKSSPMGMHLAFTALFNQGVIKAPILIKSISEVAGGDNVVQSPGKDCQACSPETAATVLELMKGVMSGGTGTSFNTIDGVTLAGKTGTAEKDGGGNTVWTIEGIVDKPENPYLCTVMIDGVDSQTSSVAAGKIASEVLASMVNL